MLAFYHAPVYPFTGQIVVNFTTTIWEGALLSTYECCMILDSVADWIAMNAIIL